MCGNGLEENCTCPPFHHEHHEDGPRATTLLLLSSTAVVTAFRGGNEQSRGYQKNTLRQTSRCTVPGGAKSKRCATRLEKRMRSITAIWGFRIENVKEGPAGTLAKLCKVRGRATDASIACVSCPRSPLAGRAHTDAPPEYRREEERGGGGSRRNGISLKRADRRCQGSPVEVPRGRERKAFFLDHRALWAGRGTTREHGEREREGGGKQTRLDHKASFSGSVTDSHHHHIIKASRLDIPHAKNGNDSNRNSPPPHPYTSIHLSTICAAPEPTLHPVLASKAPLFKPPPHPSILVPHSVVSHLPHSSTSSQRCLVLHPPPASMCQHSFFFFLSSPFIHSLFLS